MVIDALRALIPVVVRLTALLLAAVIALGVVSPELGVLFVPLAGVRMLDGWSME